jgi:hypothetical protein
MKRMILGVLLATAAMAQAPREEKTTKLVKLQFVEPRAIANIVSLYGVQITSNEQMKVMALFGTPTQIAAAEGAIKQLDVGPKTLELTVYFVIGGDKETQQMVGAPAVPADIRDVITQLKGAFAYKEYRMMDVLTLRTRAGSEAETSGLVSSGSPPRMTQFSIRNSTIGEDGTIRLDRMHAGLRIPFQKEANKMDYLNSGIDQSVDVKEGQKVVVGRSSLDGPEKAMFLILMARVVQ